MATPAEASSLFRTALLSALNAGRAKFDFAIGFIVLRNTEAEAEAQPGADVKPPPLSKLREGDILKMSTFAKAREVSLELELLPECAPFPSPALACGAALGPRPRLLSVRGCCSPV